MWRYEVLYRDNGIWKNKGFGYRDKFEKFVNRLMNNPARYTYIETFDATVPHGYKEILRNA